MLSHDAWVRLLFLNADTLLNAFLYQKKKRLLEHDTFFPHLSAISFAIPVYR